MDQINQKMSKTKSVTPASNPLSISPSLMCADQCRIEESVRRIAATGADMVHIDLMDAHFTPNMPMGLELIKQLRPRTDLPFDVHLMVEDNNFFIADFRMSSFPLI